ncbi:MAG: P1 family peptidase, partial [Rudaea sp.]
MADSSPAVEEKASLRPRARDLGIKPGLLSPGPLNAITDVAGVRVGHTTLIKGEGKLVPSVGPIRTGVTAVIPHEGDLFHDKCTGAIVRINGFGEVTNSEQVHEMGVVEGPLMLTNTQNVPRVADAVIDWMFDHDPGMGVTSWGISPIVAETHDGLLNDIRGRHVHREHVFHAIESAHGGPVEEGALGGGTGMICYEFKGGIGTSSRRLTESEGGYTVGVLVQSNFGVRARLMIDGVPVGRELEHYQASPPRLTGGSVIVVMATDAPMSHRQLMRLGL